MCHLEGDPGCLRTSNVVQTAAAPLRKRLPHRGALLTAKIRAEPELQSSIFCSPAKDQQKTVTPSMTVTLYAVVPWKKLEYDVSREPHTCPPPSQRAVRSVWLSFSRGSPKQTSKAKSELQSGVRESIQGCRVRDWGGGEERRWFPSLTQAPTNSVVHDCHIMENLDVAGKR